MTHSYKIRDRRTGKYVLVKNGKKRLNFSLGYANGRSIGLSVSDMEAMKFEEDKNEQDSKQEE